MFDFLQPTADGVDNVWNDRKNKVIELARALEEDTFDPEISEQLSRFIADEKWEVRNEVAKAMVWVSDSSMPAFRVLLTDRNGFVVKDAQIALAKRNLILKNAAKQEVNESRLFRNVERLSRLYGPEIAEAAKEDALDAIQLMMGYFVHDIRGIVAPITACQDTMYSIVERRLDAFELLEYNKEAKMVKRRVKMIEDLADDVRELSKRTPKEKMQEDIKGIIMTAVDDTEKIFEGKNRDISKVSFSTEGVPPNIVIPVDRPAILRALTNLLKNAVESYMPTEKAAKEGVVEISAQKVENGVKVFIRDYGIGMSELELTRHRKFVPRCTSRKKKGTGLGLAIAYTKIKEHGGSLELDSEGCDKGSTVTIFLPENTNE